MNNYYASYEIAEHFSQLEDFHTDSDRYYCKNNNRIIFGTLEEIRRNVGLFTNDLTLISAPTIFEVETYKNRYNYE